MHFPCVYMECLLFYHVFCASGVSVDGNIMNGNPSRLHTTLFFFYVLCCEHLHQIFESLLWMLGELTLMVLTFIKSGLYVQVFFFLLFLSWYCCGNGCVALVCVWPLFSLFSFLFVVKVSVQPQFYVLTQQHYIHRAFGLDYVLVKFYVKYLVIFHFNYRSLVIFFICNVHSMGHFPLKKKSYRIFTKLE